MFCSKCGSQIEEGMKFCASCGTPTEIENEISENVVPDNAVPQAIPAQVGEKKKAPKAVIIIALVLALGALVAGVIGIITYFSPEARYERIMEEADAVMDEDEYEAAIELFRQAQAIDDSKEVKKQQKHHEEWMTSLPTERRGFGLFNPSYFCIYVALT